MTNDALLPCPFCGKTPEVTSGLFQPSGRLYGLLCKCDVYFDCRKPSEAEAIAAWNTRAQADAPAPIASAVADAEARIVCEAERMEREGYGTIELKNAVRQMWALRRLTSPPDGSGAKGEGK